MKKLKAIVTGVVSLCMLSTVITSVSASELDDLFTLPTIGESQEFEGLAKPMKDYKDALEKVQKAEEDLNDIKNDLDNKKYGTPDYEETLKKLEEAKKDIEEAKKELETSKKDLEKAQEEYWKQLENQWDDDFEAPEIGDSDFTIGESDDDDFTIGESDYDKDDFHHKFDFDKHHHHKEFKQDKWFGSISCDFEFTKHGKFKDKDSSELKDSVLALMDAYGDTEMYIADGSETWWLKNKNQLSVKISSEDGDYKVKFNPIYEDGVITSCYMYVVTDEDVISEGYIITADEYASLKTSINDAFLKDDAVAINQGIKDFDDFMNFIDTNYATPDDYFYDVDGSGSVNVRDLLVSKKQILRVSEELGNYDCNNDGNVDVRDLVQVKKKILRIED